MSALLAPPLARALPAHPPPPAPVARARVADRAPPTSDLALIQRVISAGDRMAFCELVTRHQSTVRLVLRKLTKGNAALADDLAQETFILAWRNIHTFRFEAKFSTWIYRIAFNAYMGEMRKTREVLVEDLEAMPVDEPADIADDADTTVDKVDLDRAMATLSEPERKAIVACYYGDLSHDEAAKLLKMPLGTLKTHVLKAKQKLKARLEF